MERGNKGKKGNNRLGRLRSAWHQRSFCATLSPHALCSRDHVLAAARWWFPVITALQDPLSPPSSAIPRRLLSSYPPPACMQG